MKTIVLTKEQTVTVLTQLQRYEGLLYSVKAQYRDGNIDKETMWKLFQRVAVSDIDARLSSEIDTITDIVANFQEMLKGNA